MANFEAINKAHMNKTLITIKRKYCNYAGSYRYLLEGDNCCSENKATDISELGIRCCVSLCSTKFRLRYGTIKSILKSAYMKMILSF